MLAVDRPLQCDLLEYNSFDMKGNAVDITSLDFWQVCVNVHVRHFPVTTNPASWTLKSTWDCLGVEHRKWYGDASWPSNLHARAESIDVYTLSAKAYKTNFNSFKLLQAFFKSLCLKRVYIHGCMCVCVFVCVYFKYMCVYALCVWMCLCVHALAFICVVCMCIVIFHLISFSFSYSIDPFQENLRRWSRCTVTIFQTVTGFHTADTQPEIHQWHAPLSSNQV